MFQWVKMVLIGITIAVVWLEGAAYPMVSVSIASIHGRGIKAFERRYFLDGFASEIQKHSEVLLRRYAPYRLKIRIEGYRGMRSFHNGRYRARLKAYYRLESRYAERVLEGSVPYKVSLHLYGAQHHDPERAIKKVMKRFGERVAERFLARVRLESHYFRRRDTSSRNLYRETFRWLREGMAIDLESARATQKGHADLAWEAVYGREDLYLLTLLKGMKIAAAPKGSYKRLRWHDAKDAKMNSYDLFIAIGDMPSMKHRVFLFRTIEGHYGKMMIMNFRYNSALKKWMVRIRWKFLSRKGK